MSNYKFHQGQRVITPLGAGEIDTMPYNEETLNYGVWLDRPFFRGTRPENFLVIHESKITESTPHPIETGHAQGNG